MKHAERRFTRQCTRPAPISVNALAVHGLAGQDPEMRVVNPARRELERRICRNAEGRDRDAEREAFKARRKKLTT